MSDTIKDTTLQILIRIQDSISDLRKEMGNLQQFMQSGFAKVDEQARKNRRDVAGMPVMMKSTAGDFDERVAAVEQRMNVYDKGQ